MAFHRISGRNKYVVFHISWVKFYDISDNQMTQSSRREFL